MLEKRFKPTDQDREVVRLLSGFALPHDRICKAVRNPLTRRAISVQTLLRHFEHEMEQGRPAVDQLLAGTLAKKLRDGNIVAAIWISKNLWGWTDRVEQQRTGHTHTDVNIKIAPEELSDKLREYGLPDYVFGVDKPAPLIEGSGSPSYNRKVTFEGNGLAQDDGDLDTFATVAKVNPSSDGSDG
jgi:hypothetical protein